MQISELPSEIILLALDFAPKIKCKKIEEVHRFWNDEIYQFEPIMFTCYIEYINHMASFTINAYGAREEKNVEILTQNINKFIDEIDKGIPSTIELCPKYYPIYLDITPHSNFEYMDNFVVINHSYKKDREITTIKYSHDHYIIGNIILAKDGYQFVHDLLEFIKQHLLIPT